MNVENHKSRLNTFLFKWYKFQASFSLVGKPADGTGVQVIDTLQQEGKLAH